jgi:hypothetical protein
MSASSQKRSEEFLKISGWFKLGTLDTEISHPATANLSGVANGLLFEVLEYAEPRMKSDQAYPPVAGLAVLRARHGLTNEQAEERLKKEIN